MKRLELTLILAVLLLFTYAAAAGAEQREIADQVLRLHVIANSDEEEDQRVKLLVRDAVLAYCEPLLELAEDQREVRVILSGHLQEIVNLAQQTLWDAGSSHPVTLEMAEGYYPTRDYGEFALPAGRYVGLRLRIGEAVGQNWWCVVFPPLCENASMLEENGLSEEQAALTRRDGTRYAVRFKTAEWVSQVRQAFQSGNGKLT